MHAFALFLILNIKERTNKKIREKKSARKVSNLTPKYEKEMDKIYIYIYI
jgi:hypothetical protein